MESTEQLQLLSHTVCLLGVVEIVLVLVEDVACRLLQTTYASAQELQAIQGVLEWLLGGCSGVGPLGNAFVQQADVNWLGEVVVHTSSKALCMQQN